MDYTKGKWEACLNRVGGYNVKANGKVIASVHHIEGENKQGYGDARLIAAAPELYEACKLALDFMTALDIERKVISGLSLQLHEAIIQAERE